MAKRSKDTIGKISRFLTECRSLDASAWVDGGNIRIGDCALNMWYVRGEDKSDMVIMTDVDMPFARVKKAVRL